MNVESEALSHNSADDVDIAAYCDDYFDSCAVSLECRAEDWEAYEEYISQKAHEDEIDIERGVTCQCGGDIVDINADYGICFECGLEHWASDEEAALKRANGDNRPPLEDIDRLSQWGYIPPVI